MASRNQQAFRWLLEDDESEQRQPRGGRGSGGGTGRRRSSGAGGSGGGRGRIPGFMLREDAAAAAAAAAASDRPDIIRGAAGSSHLEALQEAFAGILPGDLVADVLASCSGDTAAATEVLLAMAGGGAEGGGGREAGGGATSDQAEFEAASAAAPSTASAPSGPCYWDVLPNEVKALVFDQLSLRDLARAARTCREFATHVRQQRRTLRTVVVPEGVSHTAVRGLVASFDSAHAVSLSRCAARLRFAHEFEDMMHAVALGQADRPSGVPVSHVILAKCGRADDAAVSAMCDTFASLRRVDLSRCMEVSDAAMTRLAGYTREPGAAGTGSDRDADADDGDDSSVGEEGGEGGYERDELDSRGASAGLAAGVKGLHLSPQESAAGAAPTPAVESPDSAVRRIAAQRHDTMMACTAAAAKMQHGKPLGSGLEELILKETSVSARGTKLLLQAGSATSKSLKVLDVSRCPNLGGDALDVHPRAVLETLRASGCNGLRSIVIQLPPDAPLHTLQLDSCRQLLEVVLVAHRLQALNVSHCGQLRAVSLRCRRLRTLHAVNCGSLNLAASELHCPELRDVNLFGCRKLDAEGLEATAPSLLKCVNLDLTGCVTLSRLLLPDAANLQQVSVVGCSVLRQVLLASPALRHFRAVGCSRLMNLRLGTASLQVLDLENCAHLREVQLSEASAPSTPGGGASSAGGGAGASWQQQGSAGGIAKACGRQQKALVLKGCTALPEEAKKRLRQAVTGG